MIGNGVMTSLLWYLFGLLNQFRQLPPTVVKSSHKGKRVYI